MHAAHLSKLVVLLSLAAAPGPAQDPAAATAALIARAKSLELATPYVPPPGDPLSHHAAGYAKVMCSAVFITGLDPDFAAANVGFFVAPLKERAKLGKPVVDRTAEEVRVSLKNGVTRVARYLGDQGCLTLPEGETKPHYTPKPIEKRTPAPTTPWPMGDAPEDAPSGLDRGRAQEGRGRGLRARRVPHRGLRRHVEGPDRGRALRPGHHGHDAPRELVHGQERRRDAHRLGSSSSAPTQLEQKAPIPEWQAPGDPRSAIRIADILRMSSGLRIRAPQDPDFDPQGPYPDHVYLYTGGVDSYHYAATRPQQWPPNTVGRYRNTDPVLASYLVRLAVTKRGEDYLSFPQRALFDKLGIRTMVLETDPYGNFLTQGYELASARDWARLGNLYLQDGVWNGERLLPEGYVKFVSTVAPAWQADHRPIYGGFFWINGDGELPVPREAYFMSGAGGQTTLIIPSHDLVVVRLGHFKGSAPGDEAFKRALALLMETVPKRP